MKTNRWFLIVLIFSLLVGTTSVEAASPSPAVNQPWKIQQFTSDLDGVMNLSVTFVGNPQIPILSYTLNKPEDHNLYYAHPATPVAPGNCGPNNTWHCVPYWFDDLVPGTLSPIITSRKGDHLLLHWAFKTLTMIRSTTIELTSDMAYYTYTQQDLVQLGKFGAALVGAPTLGIWGGRLELAATVSDNTDFYAHKLVYMNYTLISNTSCLVSAVNYYCAVIDLSNGPNSMGAASLKLAPDGSGGIAYSKSGNLMFAYFHQSSSLVPSNCGPNGNTWRCISIFSGAAGSTVGNETRQAVGLTGSNRAIAFTFGNTSFGKYLMHATFVGSGGNCGIDLNYLGNNVSMWECSLVAFLGIFDRSFSIAIDPRGYSVIAYQYAPDDLASVDLYLGYPRARAGMTGSGWLEQKIDGAPTTFVTTGAQAALALNGSGLGFIGYLQKEDYELPDLKIAWQQFKVSLPLMIR
jgi:hypothetical protein